MGEVKFNLSGSYGVYQKAEDESAKKPVVEENPQAKQAPAAETKNVAADKILDALNFMGLQNAAQVKKQEIDPAKYLTEDRISDIETMMTEEFEKGVEKYAAIAKAEFGSSLSEDAIMALAANAFAMS